MLTVKDLNVAGKHVVVRVDFNVPLKGGVIRDDNRIVAALPTIKELISKGARVVLMSHLGKVKHKLANGTEEEQAKFAKQIKDGNLQPVAVRLGELLEGVKVTFVPSTKIADLQPVVDEMKDGEVVLMQNTRYEKGEEKCDETLSAEWASLADAYVMDAFGSAHRAHASTYGIPNELKKLGKPVACGYLVEKEIQNLTRCVEVKDEDRPYVAILGGFKVSDKIKVIKSLLAKCDKILIGGAMAYTFKKALGQAIGTSPFEADQLEYAKEMYASGKIVLPVDSVYADNFDPEARKVVAVAESIPEGFEGLDIGPKTRELFANEIAKAKMIFWNGPMGVFEQKDFQAGTIAVCEAIAQNKQCFSVCGGGDSAAAVAEFGYKKDFSHVSTGGGASLEMIENDGHLPGVDILKKESLK